MRFVLREAVNGLLFADGLVQRIINAGMFALMRAGASKAAIRYALWTAGILALAAIEICFVKARGFKWTTALACLGWAVLLLIQKRDYRKDEREEDEGRLRYPERMAGKCIWWTMVAIDAGRAVGVFPVVSDFKGSPSLWGVFLCFAIATDALFLLIEYTASTPPRPPDRLTVREPAEVST